MQLATLNRKVESSGITQQNKMGMILDGTAFKILSDGLYSDKIGSLVRETYSNVVDSHIAAGWPDKPGWIQLPNNLDPTYVVRDEGIGLDDEGVRVTATTYFGSTKRGDNTNIGGFGLGFKSPFAYADQWTIVACKEGIKRTYSAYMTDTGEPNVALLTTENTNQPNGVEIRVPVKRHDVSLFCEAVRKQLQYFKPRPIITGGEIEWPDRTAIVSTSEFRVFESKGGYHSRTGSWRVVSGPVGFPLDVDQMEKLASLTTSTRTLLKQANGEIFFEVGEVMPSPSRESLQYNPKTVAAISARLEASATGFRQLLLKGIEDCQTYYAACEKFAAVRDSLGWQLRDILNGAVFKGQQVSEQVAFDDKLAPGVKYIRLSSYDLQKKNFHLSDASNKMSVTAKTGLYFFVDDLPNTSHRQVARIKHWMQENQKSPENLVVIRANTPGAEKHFENIIKSTGGFPADRLVYMSTIELPKVEIARTAGASARSLPGIRKIRRGSVPTSCSSKPDVDSCSEAVRGAITPGLYVITEHNEPKCPITLINEVSFVPGDVYFVPKSISSAVKPEDGWVELSEAALRLLQGRDDEITEAIRLFNEIESFREVNFDLKRFMSQLHQLKIEPPKRTSSDFWRLYRVYHGIKQLSLSDEQTKLLRLINLVAAQKWQPKQEEFKTKYIGAVSTLEENFRSNNPVLSELINGYRYNMKDNMVQLLVEKLA